MKEKRIDSSVYFLRDYFLKEYGFIYEELEADLLEIKNLELTQNQKLEIMTRLADLRSRDDFETTVNEIVDQYWLDYVSRLDEEAQNLGLTYNDAYQDVLALKVIKPQVDSNPDKLPMWQFLIHQLNYYRGEEDNYKITVSDCIQLWGYREQQPSDVEWNFVTQQLSTYRKQGNLSVSLNDLIRVIHQTEKLPLVDQLKRLADEIAMMRMQGDTTGIDKLIELVLLEMKKADIQDKVYS